MNIPDFTRDAEDQRSQELCAISAVTYVALSAAARTEPSTAAVTE